MLSRTTYTPKSETPADRQAADDLCSDVRASSLLPVGWVEAAYARLEAAKAQKAAA